MSLCGRRQKGRKTALNQGQSGFVCKFGPQTYKLLPANFQLTSEAHERFSLSSLFSCHVSTLSCNVSSRLKS